MSPDAETLLADDGDEETVRRVLERIESGELGLSPSDFARLPSLLSHRSKPVRRLAAGALAAALARESVAPALCEPLLANPNAFVRWGAAFALARAGVSSEAVTAAALAALGSDDGDVRWAAATIVTASARGSGAVLQRLRAIARTASSVERKMAILCLCDSGERDSAIYLEALADGDRLVRIAALTALGRCGGVSRAVTDAISASAAGDSEARVRRAATAVLRRLTDSTREKHE